MTRWTQNQIYKLKMGSITKTRGPSDISLMRQHSYLLEQEDAPVNLKSDNQVNEIVDVLEVQHALPDSYSLCTWKQVVRDMAHSLQ